MYHDKSVNIDQLSYTRKSVMNIRIIIIIYKNTKHCSAC